MPTGLQNVYKKCISGTGHVKNRLDPQPSVVASFLGSQHLFLVDTGSAVSILSYKHHYKDINPVSRHLSLRAVNGTGVNVIGSKMVTITLGSKIF